MTDNEPNSPNDDLRFSVGTERISEYRNIEIPENPREYLQILSVNTLKKDEFGNLGTISYETNEGESVNIVLLKESHDIIIFNPKLKTLKRILYTCSPVKTGKKTFEETTRILKKEPYHKEQYQVIVNKEIAKREETMYGSMQEAMDSLKLDTEKEHYLSCVFFDVPEKKTNEESLDLILSKALHEGSPKPMTELSHMFADQGFSYNHISSKYGSFSHSFNGLHSLQESALGPGKDIFPLLLNLEKALRSKCCTVRKSA